jgi:hypothetical protein
MIDNIHTSSLEVTTSKISIMGTLRGYSSLQAPALGALHDTTCPSDSTTRLISTLSSCGEHDDHVDREAEARQSRLCGDLEVYKVMS